jgi:oligo-1,6-glucosidase/alpha-glucosidase
MSEWWGETVFYHIYPRSFADSDGDGIGDIRGIIGKLDYLASLGVDALWVSPFYASPQADFGYDIADYLSIAPEYGCMDDCRELISQSHARGLKIIFDMVLNHTSDQHPWFIESRASKASEKRGFYVWRPGRDPKRPSRRPPNNWLSKVSGSGWHYDEATDEWYWAAFLPCQPDLNWRDPRVEEAMLGVLRHWLDLGVDGFRLDIIGSIYEDAAFRDNPPSARLLPTGSDSSMFFRSAAMTENLPETFELAARLRALVDEYGAPPRFLVGEAFGAPGTLRSFLKSPGGAPGLHTVFLFGLIDAPFTARALREVIASKEEAFGDEFLPALALSNHDVMRRVSALGGSINKARLSAFLQLCLRGIPFIYYGEELGMAQADFGFEDALDPVAKPFSWMPRPLQRAANGMMKGRLCRDGARTPMIWDADAPAMGFSPAGAARPWLPFSKALEGGAAQQETRPDSTLRFYKALLAFRKAHPALRAGSERLLPRLSGNPAVLAFEREGGGERIVILANLSGRPAAMGLRGEALFSTRAFGAPPAPAKTLGPWEGLALKLP